MWGCGGSCRAYLASIVLRVGIDRSARGAWGTKVFSSERFLPSCWSWTASTQTVVLFVGVCDAPPGYLDAHYLVCVSCSMVYSTAVYCRPRGRFQAQVTGDDETNRDKLLYQPGGCERQPLSRSSSRRDLSKTIVCCGGNLLVVKQYTVRVDKNAYTPVRRRAQLQYAARVGATVQKQKSAGKKIRISQKLLRNF